MNDNMEFRKAKREEAEEILQLYQSLIGTEYCVWTENYPTEREVEFDLSRDALFCLREKPSGRLIGTISIDDDPEVEALSCWSEDLTPVAELSRLGVAAEYQNHGIARILLREAMAELKNCILPQQGNVSFSDIPTGVMRKNYRSDHYANQ